MDLNLNGKTALVTGSTKGIGKAIAAELAQNGVDVYINGRNRVAVKEIVAELQGQYPAVRIYEAVADLTNENERTLLFKKVPEVDILVNNLGIYELMSMSEVTPTILEKYIATNALVGHYLTHYYLPGMKANNFGRVIFMASEEAVMPSGKMPQYSVTKTMLLAISKNFSMEIAGTDVTVNSVLPGPTLSENVYNIVNEIIQEDLPFEEKEQIFMQQTLPQSQLRRFIRPQEIARLVSFMSSPYASAFRGTVLRMDGGLVPTIY